MAGPLLISEPLQRYRALGLAGDPVWRAAGQLRAAIAAAPVARACRPAGDSRGRSVRPRASTGTRRSTARCAGSPISATASAPASPTTVQRLHGDLATLAEFDGGAAALRRRAQLRPPAAPRADRAGRGDALRRRRQAGDDLLGLLAPTPPCPASSCRARPSCPRRRPLLPRRRRPKRCSPRRRRSRLPPVDARDVVAVAAARAAAAAAARAASPGCCGRTCRISSRGSRPRRATVRSTFSVRQPVELQNVRLATLQQDNENLRLELARLTDELAPQGRRLRRRRRRARAA